VARILPSIPTSDLAMDSVKKYQPAVARALVFKQYDSQVNGVAGFTPHSAFDLPDIPPDAPLRQSIEIRCLVTYG